MKSIFFFLILFKPSLYKVFVFFFFSVSMQCFSQLDNLKQKGIQQGSKLNLTRNEGKSLDMLKYSDDTRILTENFESLYNKLDNLINYLSDSSLSVNKDSIKNQLIHQLEIQQTLWEGLPDQLDIAGDKRILTNPTESIKGTLNKLISDVSTEELKEIIEKTQSILSDSFNQRVSGVFKNINPKTLLNQQSITQIEKALDPYHEGFENGLIFSDLLPGDARHTFYSRINRKVGFESIAFTEVITQNKSSFNKMSELSKWKIGMLYSLAESLSFSSLIHGYLAFHISTRSSLIFGGGLKLKANNNFNRNFGHGINGGFRQYMYKNWFVQAIYERNHITIERPKPYHDMSFKGKVYEGSIGLGKPIDLNRYFSTIITVAWNPFYTSPKSLQGSRFGLMIGFEINKSRNEN